MPRVTPPLVLSEDQHRQIARWLAALGTPQQVALRCRIILAIAAGKTEIVVAAENRVNRKTVRLWRERFRTQGLRGLWEIAPGRGRKATYDSTRIKTVIDATLQSKPRGNTHWSCRLMATAQGISKSTVSNIWRSHNIKPHRTKTFQAVTRSEVLGEAHRRGRPVSESSGQGDRALHRREEPNPGSGSHPARAPAQEGALRHDDSRL